MAQPTALERAIEHFGTQAALADAIKRSRTMVHYWVRRGSRISAEDAAKIERATGGQVTRAELRPDIFGDGA